VGVAQVRNGVGEGCVIVAAKAIDEKMVDGVATFDQAIAKLAGPLSDAPSSRARAAPRAIAAELRRAAARAVNGWRRRICIARYHVAGFARLGAPSAASLTYPQRTLRLLTLPC
jgi:hypothetical protein